MIWSEIRPFALVILNVIAGYLVTKGLIDASSKEDFVNLMINLLSFIVYAIGAAFTLSQFFKNERHKMSKNAEVEIAKHTLTQTVSNTTSDGEVTEKKESMPVFTEDTPLKIGN